MHHHIILSSKCQNRCRFCATGLLDYSLCPTDVIDFLDISDGDTVLLTGGEPTMYKGFVDVAKYIKDRGGEVEILTNSIKFSNDKFCAEASEYIDAAQCSFYSWSESITAYLTNNKTSYKKTVSGIHNLIDAGVKVDIKTLVNLRPCYHTLDMTVHKIIDEFSVDGLWLSGCDFVGTLQTNHGLIVSLKDCIGYIDNAIDVATSSGVEIYLMYIPLCTISKRNSTLAISRPGGCAIDAYMSVDGCNDETNYDYTYGYECNNCALKDRCTGVWSKYMNMYNGGII